MTSTYRDPEAIVVEVRSNIETAQKCGVLDPKWQVTVQAHQYPTCTEIAARIKGDAVTDEFLTCPISDDDDEINFTDEALALAGQVRELMDPAFEWQDGRDRIADVAWGEDGLPACW